VRDSSFEEMQGQPPACRPRLHTLILVLAACLSALWGSAEAVHPDPGRAAGSSPPSAITDDQMGQTESRIKAALAFKLTQFATWPGEWPGSRQRPLRFCVWHADQIAYEFEHQLGQEGPGSRPIEVLRLAGVERIDECHAVYVGSRDPAAVEAVLGPIARHPIFTIHEQDRASAAAVARMFRDGEVTRFEINLAALQRAGLALSPKLTRSAVVVNQ
jgi:hypothetical protein